MTWRRIVHVGEENRTFWDKGLLAHVRTLSKPLSSIWCHASPPDVKVNTRVSPTIQQFSQAQQKPYMGYNIFLYNIMYECSHLCECTPRSSTGRSETHGRWNRNTCYCKSDEQFIRYVMAEYICVYALVSVFICNMCVCMYVCMHVCMYVM